LKRPGFFIRFIFFAVVAIALCVFGYIKANESWQQKYRDRITKETVDLLQNNPFDKLAVVVIVIDGLRWDEGIGAKDEYIPHIYDDLRPMGTLLTNVSIKSPTATTSSHTAMVTGRVSEAPNDGHIRPVFPTMHEYFRDARSDYLQTELDRIFSYPPGLFRPDEKSREEIEKRRVETLEFPPEKTALYLGKDLIYSINQSSDGRYPDDDVFLKDNMRDIEVTDYFRAKIPDVRPNMIFVNLGDVDETGHEVEWHYYVDAIRAADECVWTMWNATRTKHFLLSQPITAVTISTTADILITAISAPDVKRVSCY